VSLISRVLDSYSLIAYLEFKQVEKEVTIIWIHLFAFPGRRKAFLPARADNEPIGEAEYVAV
jgi:hypothetical protein